MSASKKKSPTDELMESLLKDVKSASDDEGVLNFETAEDNGEIPDGILANQDNLGQKAGEAHGLINLDTQVDNKTLLEDASFSAKSQNNVDYEATRNNYEATKVGYESTRVAYESTRHAYESTRHAYESTHISPVKELSLAEQSHSQETINLEDLANQIKQSPEYRLLEEAQQALRANQDAQPVAQSVLQENQEAQPLIFENPKEHTSVFSQTNQSVLKATQNSDKTIAINQQSFEPQNFEPPPVIYKSSHTSLTSSDPERTLAVTGFQIKSDINYDDKVKISVGKQSRSSGFTSWSGGSSEPNLGQAENLRIAQDKILELESENERLRRQNEELIAASEIIKERSDLLTSQVSEYKNDRDGLEQSFKNEMILLKNHLSRKDAELQRAQFKIDELESRLKFDMKKIRVRERELENRLELIRAEKNAIVKNKDEQILDLRRKMDILQMEVDSYRQKCVDLNKQIEASQDSFKRTTRALRLAMANLELQEENKTPLKKAE